MARRAQARLGAGPRGCASCCCPPSSSRRRCASARRTCWAPPARSPSSPPRSATARTAGSGRTARADAAGQARRLALPGHPRAIVVFDAAQYPLARALLAEHPEAELWYGGDGGGDLHEAAAPAPRCASGATRPARAARERNRPLWERMEALGIESGRLGSERAPQPG